MTAVKQLNTCCSALYRN